MVKIYKYDDFVKKYGFKPDDETRMFPNSRWVGVGSRMGVMFNVLADEPLKYTYVLETDSMLNPVDQILKQYNIIDEELIEKEK